MSIKGNCKWAVHKKVGLKEWFECTKNNKMCPFVRYCPTEKVVHLTREANNCKNA